MRTLFFISLLFALCSFTSADVIDDIQPGAWYEAPNTPMSSVDPCPQRGCAYTGTGGQAMIVGAWGGGAYDTKRDRLIIWGGGHGDYGGNEIYAFSISTLTWARITNPSNPPAQDAPYAPDGAPGSSHSRNTLQYVPALDALCIFGFGGYFPSAGVASNNTDAYDFAAGVWVRKAAVPSGGCARGFTVVDTNGTVWSHGEATSGKLTHYIPETNSWTSHATNPWGWFPYAGTAAIQPSTHALYDVGGGKVLRWNLNSPNTQLTELTTTGATSIITPAYPGFVWHPSGNFVAWNGGQSVYLLNPSTLVWTQVTGAGANPGAAQDNGTYGRFRYVASKDVFVALNSTTANVFFFRLPAQYAMGDKYSRNLQIRTPGITSTPNPFSGSVSIETNGLDGLPGSSLSIYSISGQVAKSFSTRDIRNGRVIWDAVDCPPGVYLFEIRTKELTLTHKLMLAR